MFITFRKWWGHILNHDPSTFHVQTPLLRSCHLTCRIEIIELVSNVLPVLRFFGISDSVVAIANGTLCAQGKQVSQTGLSIGTISNCDIDYWCYVKS